MVGITICNQDEPEFPLPCNRNVVYIYINQSDANFEMTTHHFTKFHLSSSPD